MPTYVNTPNGGSWRGDPWDNLEEGNRSAGMQMAGMNMGMMQNNAMAQLALAKLGSDDYHFSQDRTDRLGMFNQGLQAQSNMADKQYGFLTGRANAEDAWRNKQFTYETDPNVNPFLKSQQTLNASQTDLATAMIAKMKAEQQRSEAAGNGAAPPTFRNPQEQAAYNASIASGANPAQAGSSLLDTRARGAGSKATALTSDYEGGLDEAQSGSIPLLRYASGLGELSSDNREQHNAEIGTVLQTREALKQALTDSGMLPEEAEAHLKALERKHRRSSPTVEAAQLYQRLGWQ